MVSVKVNDSTYEATVMPIVITAEKTYSRQIIIFYINGHEYRGYVSQSGKFVVNKPQ